MTFSKFCFTAVIINAGTVLARPPPAGQNNGKQYHIHTFGCQMNLADSERMAGVLDTAGYCCTENANDADVLIYNTCSIRDKAEQKVYSALGRQVSCAHKEIFKAQTPHS